MKKTVRIHISTRAAIRTAW